MKRLFVLAAAALAISPVFAANENEEAFEATNTEVATAAAQAAPAATLPKISGYLQTGYQWTNSPVSNTAKSSFQAKRLRLIMDGNCGEKIDFRLQIEAFNGINAGKGEASAARVNGQKDIQVMDAFATWKIMPEFKIRAGQFYTPLGYENYDISPATLETVDFSDIVYNMACRNPYAYNYVDYGRDLGIMFIGDVTPYFHYDVALTNGQIPCKDDYNTGKDLYISATIKPVKNFNIKATYTIGDMQTGYASAGGKGKGTLNRFVAGAWYNDPTGWDVRAEYGTMNGYGNGTKVQEQGAYALVGYHVGKLLPVARWSWYMNKGAMASAYNNILVGATYQLTKNTKIQLNYQHKMYGDTNPGYKSDDKVQVMGLFKF